MVCNCVGMWELGYEGKERDTLRTSRFGNLRSSKLFSCGFLLVSTMVSNYIITTCWRHTAGKRDVLGVPIQPPTLSIRNDHLARNHTPNQTRPQATYICSPDPFKMGRKASRTATCQPWKDQACLTACNDGQQMLNHSPPICVLTPANGTPGDLLYCAPYIRPFFKWRVAGPCQFFWDWLSPIKRGRWGLTDLIDFFGFLKKRDGRATPRSPTGFC